MTKCQRSHLVGQEMTTWSSPYCETQNNEPYRKANKNSGTLKSVLLQHPALSYVAEVYLSFMLSNQSLVQRCLFNEESYSGMFKIVDSETKTFTPHVICCVHLHVFGCFLVAVHNNGGEA
jgi:hypothetical protein